MGRKFKVSRRTVLRGLGVTMALPMLDIMAEDPITPGKKLSDPPRMACFYIPGAISRHYWYPKDDGLDYTLSPTLETIKEYRDQFTLIRGLQHMTGRIGGHPHATNFLTGHNTMQGPGYPNTVSMDQIFASFFGNTYLSSMVLSFSRGIGQCTLSRTALGADIPGESDPKVIFNALFPPENPAELDSVKRRLQEKKSVLDAVMGELGRFNKRLGYVDRQRVEQYTTSIRDIENRINIKQEILAKPRANVDLSGFNFEAAPSMQNHIELLVDLIVLGFQTDLSRVATFPLGGDDGGPEYKEYFEWAKVSGYTYNHTHEFFHAVSKGEVQPDSPVAKAFAMRDALYTRCCVGRLIDKLSKIPAKDGMLLDHTQILFGGSQKHTHDAVDGPLLVAGGKKLGWKHGQHKVYWHPQSKTQAKVPLSNLYLTMLQQAGCPVTNFKESTGTLSELLM